MKCQLLLGILYDYSNDKKGEVSSSAKLAPYSSFNILVLNKMLCKIAINSRIALTHF